MATVLIERFSVPGPARDARALELALGRAQEALAQRGLWCGASLPRGRAAAERLRGRLRRASGGEIAAERLDVPAAGRLRTLGERLDGMIGGGAEGAGQPGAEDRETCADALREGEQTLGRRVQPGDLVILCDSPSALLAQCLRERGAHVVWHVAPPRATPPASAAWAFMRGYTSALDGYLAGASRREGDDVVEQSSASMPAAGLVAGVETRARESDPSHDVGWAGTLAWLLELDRDETVGGTLHPRPGVAAR